MLGVLLASGFVVADDNTLNGVEFTNPTTGEWHTGNILVEWTNDDEINIVEKGETEKISTSGITGGVIGILGKRVTIIAGSFIILIVLALIYVNLRKKEDEEFA